MAVITAAETLPVMELRPGLKDVRRPAELMYAYIDLSLLVGARTEEARALRWDHVNLEGDTDADPPVPPHVAVWRSVRERGETKTKRSRRTLGLPQMAAGALGALRESQAHERALAGARWQDTGLVFTTHRGTALDADRSQRVSNCGALHLVMLSPKLPVTAWLTGVHARRDRTQNVPFGTVL